LKFVEREYLPTFDFRGCIAIVVVGRDGLVANAAKYVGDLPIVAVNPDPQWIDGVLLPFHVRQAGQAVKRAAEGRAKIREVTLAEVNLNDGQRMLAFNDFLQAALFSRTGLNRTSWSSPAGRLHALELHNSGPDWLSHERVVRNELAAWPKASYKVSVFTPIRLKGVTHGNSSRPATIG
jgi:hypothetical protein